MSRSREFNFACRQGCINLDWYSAAMCNMFSSVEDVRPFVKTEIHYDKHWLLTWGGWEETARRVEHNWRQLARSASEEKELVASNFSGAGQVRPNQSDWL